ncbi:MAG TPA: aminotransferase class III-fold pyridoxal phosphate-dependent enzyme [Pseudobacteroides sp.]|uniref:aminotransferase family protein n=1 Tax=Pseudobacteroides sp. TaxID=1968840 RepID=UPI002F956227
MNTLNLRTVIDTGSDVNYPVWHPFSNTTRNYFSMLNITKGEGIYLYDINNRKYLDASSGLWNISLGYGNKKIEDYILKQLNRLPYCSLFDYTNPTVVLAASKILSILPPNMKKIFFTCSGSESIELSIKIMRKFWALNGHPEKKLIVSLNGSYHGTYYGSISISGIEQEFVNDISPLPGEAIFINGGICRKCKCSNEYPSCDSNCVYNLEEIIKKNIDKIAGIVIEPILASKGVEVLSEKFITGVYNICQKYQLLLAIDEVAVGFFRTGESFYIKKYGIEPDIICMGKGINSGYLPMGAVSVNSRIVEAYSSTDGVITHGSTQGGNLLSCAACIASIEQYEVMNIGANVKAMGDHLKKQLSDRLLYHPNVGEIRGEGLLLEVELFINKNSGEHLTTEQICTIQEILKNNGLIVYRSDVGLTILPMLIADKDNINNLVDILDYTFKHISF